MRMVRLAACGAGLWLLGVASPTLGAAQAVPGLQHRDRVRLAESIRLVKELRPGLWPGWERTRLSVLLVTESAEFLIGHSQPSAGFSSVGYDTLLKRPVWTRPRQFPPTLLATFPAVGGMPTIVLGTAEHTGKSSTAWVLTLLHEHFHQWQYTPGPTTTQEWPGSVWRGATRRASGCWSIAFHTTPLRCGRLSAAWPPRWKRRWTRLPAPAPAG